MDAEKIVRVVIRNQIYSERNAPDVDDPIVNELDLKRENHLVAKPSTEEGDSDSGTLVPPCLIQPSQNCLIHF